MAYESIIIPVADISLTPIAPRSSEETARIPVADIGLTAQACSFVWNILPDELAMAQRVFLCVITGAANGLDDITVPIEAFQATMRNGSPSYLVCSIPDIDSWRELIQARSNGSIVIKTGLRLQGGNVQAVEIITVNYEELRWERIPGSSDGLLTGYKTISGTAAQERPLSGASYYAQDGDGKRRVRADVNYFLRCGDTCIFGPEPGDSMVAGTISYAISKYLEIMEVAEE
jgi:hypothetical protein